MRSLAKEKFEFVKESRYARNYRRARAINAITDPPFSPQSFTVSQACGPSAFHPMPFHNWREDWRKYMKLASGRPWARGPQFYSLLLRLMGVVRSTLRLRDPRAFSRARGRTLLFFFPSVASPISLSRFPFQFFDQPPLRLLQASRYESVARLLRVSNLMRVGKIFRSDLLLLLIKVSSLSSISNFYNF